MHDDDQGPASPEFIGPRIVPPGRELDFALEFERVTFRVFPLRANSHRLQTFCDQYLNMDLSPEVLRFRPAAPWVFLSAINYGRLSTVASNLGWISQNEFLFSVPLEWYREEDGQPVFQDWASVAPFIFVDDELSTATGREIYGWPKILAFMHPEANAWMKDPRAPRQLLTVKTLMFSDLYAGHRLEPRPLLEIEQEVPETPFHYPPRLRQLLDPLVSLPETLVGMLSSVADLLQVGGLVPSLTRDRLQAFGRLLGRNLGLGGLDFFANTINLKQFRSSMPSCVCYQSLVNARIEFKRFHGGGPLGDVELLRGRSSAGFGIRLHRHPAYPIVECLGLELDAEEEVEGRRVAVLRPVLPFWFSADLRYRLAERLAWRTEHSRWYSGTESERVAGREHVRRSGKESTAASTGGETEAGTGSGDRAARAVAGSNRFNTALGPIVQALEGPFDFFDTTVRMILVTADHEKLSDFVARNFDLPEELGFSLDVPSWEGLAIDAKAGKEEQEASRIEQSKYSTVVLTFFNFGQVSTQANDVGLWANRELAFVVPVRLRPVPGLEAKLSLLGDRQRPEAGGAGGAAAPTKAGAEGEIKEFVALFWPYVFADSPIAVRTAREVTGKPTEQASIEPGVDPWAEGHTSEVDGEPGWRRLLTVKVQDYPALNVGQRAEQRVLLELEGRPRREAAPVTGPPSVSEEPGIGLSVDNLFLKQFRDAEHPDHACHQAIMFSKLFLGRWHEEKSEASVKSDDFEYKVMLHETPAHPILETLGLRSTKLELRPDGSKVHTLQSVKDLEHLGPTLGAASLQVDLRYDSGAPLCWRGVGFTTWREPDKGLLELCRSSRSDLGYKDVGKFIRALTDRLKGAKGAPPAAGATSREETPPAGGAAPPHGGPGVFRP